MTATKTHATPAMIAKLGEPIPPELVKTKPGRGGSGDLSFIDARVVFDRFDAVLGPHLWQVEIPFTSPMHTPEIKTRNGRVLYQEWTSTYPLARIGVFTVNGWVWKQDIGDFSDIEPVKGSVSDSIKRAAVQWGVGRELYDPTRERERASTSGDAAETSGSSSSADASETGSDGDQSADVVGKPAGGITDKQRNMFFALLQKAGVTGDQRKALLFLVTQRRSVKQLTQDDLQKLVEVLEAPRDKHPEIWENVELVDAG